MIASDAVAPRTFSPKRREKLAAEGYALPDGSYPIPDVGALKRAIQAIGRAGPKGSAAYETVKRHIIVRARALHALDELPDEWRTVQAHPGHSNQKVHGHHHGGGASHHLPSDHPHAKISNAAADEFNTGLAGKKYHASPAHDSEHPTLNISQGGKQVGAVTRKSDGQWHKDGGSTGWRTAGLAWRMS